MQRGNANFSFNRLGVIVRRYYVDFYGEMADELNAGLASDRVEAEWAIDSNPTPLAVEMANIPFLLQRHGILPAPERRRRGSSWRVFLNHYNDQFLACDCFTVETLGLNTLYVLFFVEHGTRRIHLAGCTAL
jgi:hypothetical protein